MFYSQEQEREAMEDSFFSRQDYIAELYHRELEEMRIGDAAENDYYAALMLEQEQEEAAIAGVSIEELRAMRKAKTEALEVIDHDQAEDECPF